MLKTRPAGQHNASLVRGSQATVKEILNQQLVQPSHLLIADVFGHALGRKCFQSAWCYSAILVVVRPHSKIKLPDAFPKKFRNTSLASA